MSYFESYYILLLIYTENQNDTEFASIRLPTQGMSALKVVLDKVQAYTRSVFD
jgi:hypothetical protein